MLSASEARQLDRLALGARVGTASAETGGRATTARGYSVEFHDFRGYVPGDDPRTIDWTIDARLHQLVVRLFRGEGHLRLHLLVDTSASMQLGAPSKLAAAAKTAAALAYVAVARRDRVSVATFDEAVRRHVAVATGTAQLFRIFDVLKTIQPSGRSRLDHALAAYGNAVRGPGLAVVLSDFFDPALTLDGLRFLLFRGLAVAVVQVLAEEEIDPRVTGPTELVDVEDPAGRMVNVDAASARADLVRLSRATSALAEFCSGQAVPFVRVRASSSFDEVVAACTRGGLLALHA